MHKPPPQGEIIEGEFRVLATRPLTAKRSSPNARRQAARIVFWNGMAAFALCVAPLLLAR